MGVQLAGSFPSAESCLADLKKKFANQTFGGPAKEDHTNTIKWRDGMPRYLFRGESGDFPTTIPACDRLGKLDTANETALLNLTRHIIAWFADPKSNFNLSGTQAVGLVQHLGLPTDYIDFSSDPEVAVAFAVGDSQNPAAQVCLIDVCKAEKTCQIAELGNHPWCLRARVQSAFGCASANQSRDLKSREGTAQTGALWFRFSILPNERGRFRSFHHKLMEPATDPVAGLLRWRINEYVAQCGKLPDQVARYCVNHIPMVPLVVHVRSFGPNGQPDVVNYLPPRDHTKWHLAREKDCSLRYWSKAHPNAILSPNYILVGMKDSQGIFAFPATYHPTGNVLVSRSSPLMRRQQSISQPVKR